MTKKELVNFLDNLYPFNNKEEWDICGPSDYENLEDEIKKVLISLDLNWETALKAYLTGCNVIITHHPIFTNDIEWPENLIVNKVNRSILQYLHEKKILHISLHTCFDRDKFGTSYKILSALDFEETPSLLPENPYLVFGELKAPKTVFELAKQIKENKLINNVRVINKQENNWVRTICIGAGSCTSYMNDVIRTQVDCFLTGDFKWHTFQDAFNANLNVIDIGHDAEQVFITTIKEKIMNEFKELLIIEYFNAIEIKEVQ